MNKANSDNRALAFFFLSDDSGRTWREAQDWWAFPGRTETGLQEPGVVELDDGSIYAWCRTGNGRQWELRSSDHGETWSKPQPSPFHGPASPMSIKWIPGLKTYLAIWNDHHPNRWTEPQRSPGTVDPSWGRTPLTACLGSPLTHRWSAPIDLEDDPESGFCYIAIHPMPDAVLLAYCCGGRDSAVLQDMRLTRISLRKLKSWTK